jgi:hypothetical protein
VLGRFLPGAGFQRRFGFADLFQPLRAARQFVGKFVAAPITVPGVFRRVGGLRLLQQFGDLLLQTLLLARHPVVAHGFVPRRVGFHLGAVQRQPAGLQQPPSDSSLTLNHTTPKSKRHHDETPLTPSRTQIPDPLKYPDKLLANMRGEWKLVCLTHNLLKLFRRGALAVG